MALRFQRQQDFSAGMDSRSDANQIQPNAVVEVLNSVIDSPGYVSTRDGVVCYGGRGLTPGGLAAYMHPSGTKRLVGFWPPSVYHAEIGSVNWLQVAPDVSLVYGGHAGVLGRDIDCNYLLFGHSIESSESAESYPRSGLFWVSPEDGSWSQTFETRPAVVTYWQDRLWFADSSQTDHYPDQVFWSKIFDGREFSLSGMNLRIDPGLGGRITALLPARGTAPQLYMFKDNGIYLLDVVWGTDGFIPLSANQIDTTKAFLRTLTLNTGCIASKSAIWVPGATGGDVYFLAPDGVRSLRRAQDDVSQGGGGVPLSWSIQSVIDRINWTYAHRARSCVKGNNFFMSVPLDGARSPNFILVKNLLAPEYQGWGLWSLETAGLVAESFPEQKMFFMGGVASTDSLTGHASPTLAAHVFQITSSTFDPGGSGITRSLTTRDFDLGEPGRRKFWRWAEFGFTGEETGITVAVYARVDGAPEWLYLDKFVIQNQENIVNLPTPLPIRFWESVYGQTKLACESLSPSYRLQLRMDDTGPGKVSIRQVEVVGQLFPKEWL